MWAIARYDLRLGEAEFWRLTPRLYLALLKRLDLGERLANLRAGLRPPEDGYAGGEPGDMAQADWDRLAAEARAARERDG